MPVPRVSKGRSDRQHHVVASHIEFVGNLELGDTRCLCPCVQFPTSSRYRVRKGFGRVSSHIGRVDAKILALNVAVSPRNYPILHAAIIFALVKSVLSNNVRVRLDRGAINTNKSFFGVPGLLLSTLSLMMRF